MPTHDYYRKKIKRKKYQHMTKKIADDTFEKAEKY